MEELNEGKQTNSKGIRYYFTDKVAGKRQNEWQIYLDNPKDGGMEWRVPKNKITAEELRNIGMDISPDMCDSGRASVYEDDYMLFAPYKKVLDTLNKKLKPISIDTRLIESKNTIDSSKIDELLETAKLKRQNLSLNDDAKYYLNLLNESKKSEFLFLSADQKQKVVNALLESKPYTENQVIQLWNNALAPVDPNKEEINELMKAMPVSLLEKWNKLDEKTKTTILENRKYYALQSHSQKLNFWLNQNALKENQIGSVKSSILNENVPNTKPTKLNDPYFEMVLQESKKWFK